MSAVAGNISPIKAATAIGGSYSDVTGAKSAKLARALDTEDTTAFEDGVDKVYTATLRGGTLSIDGTWQASDTGFGHIRTAFQASTPTTVFLQFLYNGTAGHKGEFWITKFDINSDVGGIVNASIEAMLTGALTAV